MLKLVLPLLAAVFILQGCTGTNEQGHDAVHDHGAEAGHAHDEVAPEVYTLYSDKTELFVEFPPLVKGVPASFAAHFTKLGESFTPMTEGSVTVELIVMGKIVNTTSDKPSSPGIFRLKLTPETVGNGALVFHIKNGDDTDKITISGVMVHKNEHDAAHAAKAPSDANEISFLKEQAWKIDFANKAVKKQAYPQVIRAAGMINAAPGDESVMLAPASGKLLYADGGITPGMSVKTGQRIFTIGATGITSENINRRFIEAKSRFESSKAAFERAESLIADKIISRKEYENAKTEFESAKADYNNTSKNYEQGKGFFVSAETEGFLQELNVTNGQFVNSGDRLGAVSRNRRLNLIVNVSQRYYDLLPKITGVNFRTSGSETMYQSKDLNIKLLGYGRSTGSNSPMIPVNFEMDHPGNIATGTSAEVYLQIENRDEAIIIPVTSIIEEQGTYFVYVQTGGESFIKKEITPGVGDGISVPILTGLTEGERVVTKGAHYIKLSTAAGAMPAHGHEH